LAGPGDPVLKLAGELRDEGLETLQAAEQLLLALRRRRPGGGVPAATREAARDGEVALNVVADAVGAGVAALALDFAAATVDAAPYPEVAVVVIGSGGSGRLIM
jgi:hypothetical protein